MALRSRGTADCPYKESFLGRTSTSETENILCQSCVLVITEKVNKEESSTEKSLVSGVRSTA